MTTSKVEARPCKPKRSAYDDDLPVRFRDMYGLWVKGAPTKVLIYSLTGELIVAWMLPSTALAATLCERAAGVFFMNPSRFSFVTFSDHTQTAQLLVSIWSKKPLAWLAKFEPVIQMYMFVRELTENENIMREYGWRYLRNWRCLTNALRMQKQSDVQEERSICGE